jgi:hypothetical protein
MAGSLKVKPTSTDSCDGSYNARRSAKQECLKLSFVRSLISLRSLLSRNWRHNTLNANELYDNRLYHLHVAVPNASSLNKSHNRR